MGVGSALVKEDTVAETDDVDPEMSRGKPWYRLDVRTGWALAVVLLPALLVGVAAFRRRWIGDDGLIFVRVSQQILDGNGPNFNVGERTEAATSTLWPWLLALVDETTGIDLVTLAVYGSLVCAVAGLAIATAGTRRLYADLPGGGWPLPAGALVLAALPPFWDFATSGLEMGLIFVWLGTSWSLLVRLDRDTSFRRQAWTSFALGMGVLVRPDLALGTIVFAAAAWLLLRPERKRLALLALFGGLLPVLYQIFRMGYYGVLLPNTAIAKEGTRTDVGRGWSYFEDYASPYNIWAPLLLTVVAVGLLAGVDRSVGDFERYRIRVLTATALVAGTVLLGYVIVVGGDFMHARLLLPGTFAFLLPVLVLPRQRLYASTAAALAVWSVVCAASMRVPYQGFGPKDIEDTRTWYVAWTGEPNPVTAASYRAAFVKRLEGLGSEWRKDLATPGAQFVYLTYYHEPDKFWMLNFDFRSAPLKYHVPVTDSVVYGALGQPAALVPTSGLAIDIFGLANPLGAHLELDYRTRSGHDKLTYIEWILADFTAPGTRLDLRNVDPAKVEAARRALTCGGIRELQEATRQPMSVSRFWKNLIGSVKRNSMRIPTNPIDAEKKYCH
ncbi:arabinofuranosyltransferase [Embleya sp. AB8]